MTTGWTILGPSEANWFFVRKTDGETVTSFQPVLCLKDLKVQAQTSPLLPEAMA